MGKISIFLDNDVVFEVAAPLFLKWRTADKMPSRIKKDAIEMLLTLSLLHKRINVKNPEKTKPVRCDKTNNSIFEKYLVILQIFKRAYPDKNEVLRNAKISCVILSRSNMFTKIRSIEE